MINPSTSTLYINEPHSIEAHHLVNSMYQFSHHHHTMTIPSPLNFNIQQISTQSFHSAPQPEHFHHHSHPPSSPTFIHFLNGNSSCFKEFTYTLTHSQLPHTSATPTPSGLLYLTVLSSTLRPLSVQS